MKPHLRPPLLLLLLLLFVAVPLSQSAKRREPHEDPGCNGVLLSYSLDPSRTPIRPFVPDPSLQPYRFTATAAVLNSGLSRLVSWSLLITFAHGEILVSAPGSSSPLPFNTSSLLPDPTPLSGPDLETPIATAGDLTRIRHLFPLTGTLFAPPPPYTPLPTSLSLDTPSLLCPKASLNANSTLSTCCLPDPKFRPNATSDDDPLAGAGNVTARRPGDLTISYDVIQAFPSSYLALVTLSNHHKLGRLDNWRLTWDWERGEFIYDIKGAYTSVTGAADCITGPQGQYYQDLDFSKVANCQRKPTILDLPPQMANDTIRGRIPFCCRNGTMLPAEMDPSQTQSAFQMQVFKMPPDLNRTIISPPQGWQINGGPLNPKFRCSAPARVAATRFPDPSGLQTYSLAIASWQIVCNITKPKGTSPKCCVSFSAYYNDTVVPCKTCACGCPARPAHSCSTKAPALLLPPQALLVPFDNRTELSLEWARLKHLPVPRPMPCGDYCGVSINWHVNSDFRQGWTSRVTLFNWGDTSFADWFVAAELDKAAYDGFEAMYSFNGTALGNNTIFMQGLPGLNYLIGEVNGTNPATDPRVPGKQQSVISFTKKTSRRINVAAGDGYPTKVFFNGEECSLPDIIPTNWGLRSRGTAGVVTLVLLLVATTLLLFEQ